MRIHTENVKRTRNIHILTQINAEPTIPTKILCPLWDWATQFHSGLEPLSETTNGRICSESVRTTCT